MLTVNVAVRRPPSPSSVGSPIDDLYLQFTLGNSTDGDLYNVRGRLSRPSNRAAPRRHLTMARPRL